MSSAPPASVLSRLVAALTGALLAGLVVGGIDAGYAAEGMPSLRAKLAQIGLIVPLSLAVGFAVGVGRCLLLPVSWPRAAEAVARLRGLPSEERRTLIVKLATAAFGTLLVLVVGARVALRLLASGQPSSTTGAALALVTLGLALVVVLSVVRVRAPARVLPLLDPDPVRGGALVLALAALGFAVLVAIGTTSGAGSPLAVFGVLKRQELDLRGATLVLLLVTSALLLPAARRLPAKLSYAAVALVPLLLSPWAATSGFDRKTSLAVERHAPLGKRLLPLARRLSDHDRDGASAWYFGGDCAEGNPRVSPSADDVPGNGIDEDCSGSDATASAPRPALPTAHSAEAGASIKSRLPERPNVILVTIDALRAELGFTGYSRPISPKLDALAKKSTVFENAYSLASYTSKSLGPMLIGRYGVETHRGWLHFNRFTRADTFLSERLQKAGIRTLSVQGHWYFFKSYGFERGYDVLDTEATPADQPIEGDRSSNGDKLSDRIIAQLDQPELETQQFFLWSHYIDPHAEYVPHEGFDFGHRGRDRYDGEIAFTDHHFGRVLAALERKSFAKRTVVIVTSDHGEAFGEHGLYRHGFEIWEELVRVPLVVYVPGAAPRHVAVRRSTIDVAPTVLELFGVAPPAADDKGALRGESLLPDVLPPPGHVAAARPVYIDMPAGPYNDERQAYIDGDLKLITSGGRPLGLYELAEDPGEKRDLTDDRARLQPMLEKTKAFRRALDEVIERPTK
jgi:arylsulfatase A-like enzyme